MSAQTLQDVLNSPNPNTLADTLRAVGNFGEMVAQIDEVITVDPAATTCLLTKPTKMLMMCSVLAHGTAALGPRIIGEEHTTPSSTKVKLGSDDQTLTFEGTVTSVRVKYIPLPDTDLSTPAVI